MPTTKAKRAAVPAKSTILAKPVIGSATFTELRARTRGFLDTLKSSIEQTPMEVALNQDLIGAAGVVSALCSDLDKVWEQIKVALRSRKAAGGGFELGKAMVVFKASDRCTPGWKDLATKSAGEIAAAAGKTFDPKLYQDQIAAATPAIPQAAAVSIVVGD